MANLEPESTTSNHGKSVLIEPGVGVGDIKIGMSTAQLSMRFSSDHETTEQCWDVVQEAYFDLRVGYVHQDEYPNCWVFIEERDGTAHVTGVQSDDVALEIMAQTRVWRLGDVTERNVLEVFASLGVPHNAVSVDQEDETQSISFDAPSIGLCLIFTDRVIINIEAPKAS